ncbi:MAG: hypothetical protein A2W25_16085 [candidate division Zixibacteria bacterium RBG_16_53_22]|nr:MAG: hypothetical protein A2W25_16085 [candidate division Zixibacteria bacterium RBG_16_53_22]
MILCNNNNRGACCGIWQLGSRLTERRQGHRLGTANNRACPAKAKKGKPDDFINKQMGNHGRHGIVESKKMKGRQYEVCDD